MYFQVPFTPYLLSQFLGESISGIFFFFLNGEVWDTLDYYTVSENIYIDFFNIYIKNLCPYPSFSVPLKDTFGWGAITV